MSLADLATAEFTRRHDTARRKVAGGELTPAAAEAFLRPWLALAARFGAALPELEEPATLIYPFEQSGEELTLRLRSGDICPAADMAEALASARDTAIERATGTTELRLHDRARALQTLAIALGVRGYRPVPSSAEQEAA